MKNLNQFYLLFLEVALKNSSAPFAIKQDVIIEQYALKTEFLNDSQQLAIDAKIHRITANIDMD